MRTLIGSRDIFAFEYEVDTPCGSQLLGYFNVWITGRPLGALADRIVIGGVCAQAERLIETRAGRFDEALYVLGKETAFGLLYQALYGSVHENRAHIDALARQYGSFDLQGFFCSDLERNHIFLVEGSQGQRVLWQAHDNAMVHEAYLPSATWERAAEEFIRRIAQIRAKFLN